MDLTWNSRLSNNLPYQNGISDHSKPLKILYAGLRYDYGKPQRGYSYEYINFYQSLANMRGVEVKEFALDVALREVGRDEVNRRLLTMVDAEQPDLCFFVLFTDEIKKSTIRAISQSGKTITANWFCDDHWRFESFSKFYAPELNWIVTTDIQSVEKYHRLGCRNVIHSQWAINHFSSNQIETPLQHEVTFIGQVHSRRKAIVSNLIRQGFRIECWGRGWRNGRVSEEEMRQIFSRSKINLNFSESSVAFSWKPIAKIFFKRRANDAILLNKPSEMRGGMKSLFLNRRPQIKGRIFEVPGNGGFLLTQYADRLEDFYELGKEVAVFEDQRELVEKIRYYLAHDTERETVRRAGYERTIRDHTFEKRFEVIFRTIGV